MSSPYLYRAVLHLGSNIGDRLHWLSTAIEQLGSQLEVVKISQVYVTEAWGITDQPDFFNQVVVVQTDLHPFALLDCTQRVERAIGRAKTKYWGPRQIDIDILYYEQLLISTARLTLPHPRYHIRNFVLYPLMDVDARYVHPIFGRSNEVLLAECPDASAVNVLDATK